MSGFLAKRLRSQKKSWKKSVSQRSSSSEQQGQSCEFTQAGPNKELKMKQSQPPAPAATAALHHTHKGNVEEEQSEEKDVEEEEMLAPLKLKIEFLQALMKKDFHAARALCQIILVYEPNHPEASEFLPLIKKKLEEQEAEGSNEDNEEEESSHSSTSSSSSASDDDEDQ